MLHFFHNFKISCKGNKKHSNNQIKSERYDAHFNLMFIIHTCDVFNRLNAIPPHASLQFLSRPCNSPHASLPFPSRPEGAEAPSPGHSPWVFMSARLAPCRGKSFIWRPNLRLCSSLHPRTGYGVLLIMLKCSLFGDKILLALFGLTDFGLYICTKISELWIKVYIQNYTNV